MAYELRIGGHAQLRVREYAEQFGGHDPRPIADAIEAGLNAIAAEPDAGQILSEAFGRPIHRFGFEAPDEDGDTVRHIVQAAYTVDDDAKTVTILDFGAIPF